MGFNSGFKGLKKGGGGILRLSHQCCSRSKSPEIWRCLDISDGSSGFVFRVKKTLLALFLHRTWRYYCPSKRRGLTQPKGAICRKALTVTAENFGILLNCSHKPVAVTMHTYGSSNLPHNGKVQSSLTYTTSADSIWLVGLDDWLTVHRSITLVDFQLDAQISYLFTYNTFIKILCMFRRLPCSSSGGLRRNCIYIYICSLWYCHTLQVTVLCTGWESSFSTGF